MNDCKQPLNQSLYDHLGKATLLLHTRMWLAFAAKVGTHIAEYVVPQYGDAHADEISTYTPEECAVQIRKYAARCGKNSREGQDELDMLKIADYAMRAHAKLVERREAAERVNAAQS